MSRNRDEIMRNRRRVKAQFGELFTEVEQILFRHDPMGIAFTDDEFVADNPDEYATEVETILPRLGSANTAVDVTDIIYEEFVHWFGKEETVGPKAKYQAIAIDIWAAWEHFKTNQGGIK